ncbi:diguanylate cyclase, partial [Myxococcus sp. CA039A]
GLLGETKERAKAILSRTLAEVAEMTFDGDGGESFGITVSGGIAEAPGDGATMEELLRAADARLTRAKSNGRNRIEV